MRERISQLRAAFVHPLCIAMIGMVLLLGMLAAEMQKKEIVIYADGETYGVRTYARTAEDVLALAGIVLEPYDEVVTDRGEGLEDGDSLTVLRAFDVTVYADGAEYRCRTAPCTAEEAVRAAGVYLSRLDEVDLGRDEVLTEACALRVTRVRESYETVVESVPYSTQRIDDNTLRSGLTRLVQSGVSGKRDAVYRVVFRDGEEVSRELIASKTVKEPQTRIVATGTRVEESSRETSSSSRSESLSGAKSFTVSATAYTHTGNRTRTGTWPKVGTIAVDPRVIPLGTRLYVEGYGYGVAEDTGGAIKGNKIDLFMETTSACYNWGRRSVTVYILD